MNRDNSREVPAPSHGSTSRPASATSRAFPTSVAASVPVVRHLLVTNDFPPKIGGIQNYLWELWRRLPPESVLVYTTPYDRAAEFDAAHAFRIERSPEPVLLPYPWLINRINALADAFDAELIILDPALPLGLIGPRLNRPYAVVLHGAEVTVPGRLPVSRSILRRVLRGADLVISAGEYARAEGERAAGVSLPSVVIPPGVDSTVFVPPADAHRRALRQRFGFVSQTTDIQEWATAATVKEAAEDEIVIAVVTRLVPRKGIHILIDAVASLGARYPHLRLIIGGQGRETDRLRRQIKATGAPAELWGRISDQQKIDLYAAADIMAMPCSQRWGGLEQEGFGIVFLEGAAMGLPQIAGESGGAAEAVVDGVTGHIVRDPSSPGEVAAAIETLLADPGRRRQMGQAARIRAQQEFDYDRLALRLAHALSPSALSPHALNPHALNPHGRTQS